MLALPIPPNYQYETTGPWFVAHTVGGRVQAWTMWTFESAIIRFWNYDKDRPDRRVAVDGRGIMIIGIDLDGIRMVGTREAMDATLAMVEKSSGQDETLEVLGMVETVRAAMEGT